MKAGLAVIEALRAEGVEYTFGVVGSTTNTIVTEMYDRQDIRFVDTRHEEGAAFMAYGYARASGKPTACITTSGPGTTNLVTGIALAAKGRAPTLLAQAQRPLLLVGGGVIDAEASKEAVALAELLDMALVPSYGHTDAIPNSHHLYVGPPGGRGSGEAAEALRRADVILALGTRLNQATTFWDYRVINRETRIVQVDIDAQEIGRNYPVAVGISGDARAVAEQLTRALREAHPQGRANPAWRNEIAALAGRRKQRLDAESTLAGDPMMPQRVYPELRKVLPRDCMITLDAGVAPGLAYDRLHFELPRTFFNYAGHGGLGMGYCVGLGTKLGRPDRPAVGLQGDGGFLYTSQEINTAVRWGIPLVCIVLNNNCHGPEKAQQQRHFGGRYIGVDLVNPRFDKLAEVYGPRGMYVQKPYEIADAVKTALGTNGPVESQSPAPG